MKKHNSLYLMEDFDEEIRITEKINKRKEDLKMDENQMAERYADQYGQASTCNNLTIQSIVNVEPEE